MRLPYTLASLLLVSVLGIGCTCPAQAQEAKPAKAPATSVFHITGTVLNSVTRTPVAGVKMTAVTAGRSQGQRSPGSDEFATDDQGRFDVSVASAGSWRLTARARGYVTQALDAHENFASAVVLTAANPTLDVVFPLTPNSSISGTVLDEASEPIRQARVTLQVVTSAESGNGVENLVARGAATTDDRGHYELANLAPGDYRVSVQAQVWYAQGTHAPNSTPDPIFDVVYPDTWFPGVTDSASASTITLHGGDSGQADFHLVPMPAVHLRISSPVSSPGATANGRPMPPAVNFPQILPVTSTGGMGGAGVSIVSNSQGMVDTGGIAPGLYQVRWPDSGSGARTSLIQITAISSRSLDINSASVGVHVTLKMDGTGMHNVSQVTFVDVNNPLNGFRTNELMGRGGRFRGGGGGDAAEREPRADLGIDVVPGRYRVVLSGDGDQYLTGITATGAEANGRLVTVRGDATMILHVASGRPTVSGFVRYQDKPSVGAQVLLIPATFGEPESLTMVRRDQSNTDGSYDLPEVIPGQYILIAIDHGWGVNWNDPATLRQYLIHGVPLDLRSGANIKQEIEAQAP